MKKILLSFCFLACSWAAVAQVTDDGWGPDPNAKNVGEIGNVVIMKDSENKDELNTEQIKDLEREALLMINQMSKYIGYLVSKKTPIDFKTQCVDMACGLFFNPDDNIIQVKLANGKPFDYKPVRSYFEKIKDLGYARASMEGSDAMYINAPKKGMDGNYYATATVCFIFIGVTTENKLHRARICKNFEIVIEQWEDIDGTKKWRARLGNVYLAE